MCEIILGQESVAPERLRNISTIISYLATNSCSVLHKRHPAPGTWHTDWGYTALSSGDIVFVLITIYEHEQNNVPDKVKNSWKVKGVPISRLCFVRVIESWNYFLRTSNREIGSKEIKACGLLFLLIYDWQKTWSKEKTWHLYSQNLIISVF